MRARLRRASSACSRSFRLGGWNAGAPGRFGGGSRLHRAGCLSPHPPKRIAWRGAPFMNPPAHLPRVWLIDSNVYFSKRLSDALTQQGFDVVPSMQAAYALTMLERNPPAAIMCATNLREMGA